MIKSFIPLAAALTIVAGCTSQTSTAPAAQTAPAAPSQAVNITAQSVSSGAFSGRSDHITTGTATLVKAGNVYYIDLSDDFELDGAPDPVVAVGNNETYKVENKLGALQNRTGKQRYALPANIAASNFSQVYIWCEKFSVPLGVATLAGAPASNGS